MANNFNENDNDGMQVRCSCCGKQFITTDWFQDVCTECAIECSDMLVDKKEKFNLLDYFE